MAELGASLRDEAICALMAVGAEDPAELSLAGVRSEFPIKERRCYLNNASIGALSNPVVAAVDVLLHDVRDNGRNNYPNWCRYADQHVKARVARFLGAKREEIAFVKNTTEGLAIVANGLDWRDGDNALVPDIEYPSNVYCWMKLARRGVELRWVPNRGGRILVDDIAERIDDRTRLVSLSAVQFSNGFRADLDALGQLCRERGILLNLDGIQWLGALAIDLSRYHVDFLSAGGHKWLLAPIGTGIFYCREEALNLVDPPTVGYHSVDRGEDHLDYDLVYRSDAGRFEEALVNFPGIWGLDAALKVFLGLGMDVVERQIRALTDHALEGLRRRGYEIVSPMDKQQRSGILSFRHPHGGGDEIAKRLADAGVDLAVRGGALRISPSIYNDEQEIECFLEALPRA